MDYQSVVDKFLNLYEPIGHQPKEGEFLHIESRIRHIFGEQYELGMDYLQLLYLQPVQELPILLMVSEERNTGKSTFLNFLKDVFQNNVTFNTNEDSISQFNADWAGKLLIVVGEPQQLLPLAPHIHFAIGRTGVAQLAISLETVGKTVGG